MRYTEYTSSYAFLGQRNGCLRKRTRALAPAAQAMQAFAISTRCAFQLQHRRNNDMMEATPSLPRKKEAYPWPQNSMRKRCIFQYRRKRRAALRNARRTPCPRWLAFHRMGSQRKRGASGGQFQQASTPMRCPCSLLRGPACGKRKSKAYPGVTYISTSLPQRTEKHIGRSDPFATRCEHRPGTASMVWGLPRYEWTDEAYYAANAGKDHYSVP